MRRWIALAIISALVLAACGGDAAPGPDLEIERRTGFVVAVERSGGSVLIGFNVDEDAITGDALDVTEALWRVDEGPFTEPPPTCITAGSRVEVGVSKVQRSDAPGLVEDRVVWVSCLTETP